MGTVTNNRSVELAIAVLQEAANENRPEIVALLKKAGLEVLSDPSAAEQPNGQRYPLVLGQPVTHPGVPFGEWKSGRKTISLNLIPDFLRDASGEIVVANGNEAVESIAALNGGVKYGNGYEKDTARAIAKGEFKNGTLILARQEDLLKIAHERQTNPSLGEMNKIIAGGSHTDSWCMSSTEYPSHPSDVYHVRLKDGASGWSYKDDNRSRVVALRGVTLG